MTPGEPLGPEHLKAVPQQHWMRHHMEGETSRPLGVWRSRHFLAIIMAAHAFRGIEVRRLTVTRHMQCEITWEDLQRCKREVGCGDLYAVEVYPRDRDLWNGKGRHLWLLDKPIKIGWFSL